MLISSNLGMRLGALFAEFIASILIVYFIAFTFGASLIEDLYNNLLFSILVASIAFLPALILVPHRNPYELFIRVFVSRDFENNTEEACMVVAYGCAIGAWFGCFVLPLDWDRWWQQWPLPCCFGALFGSLIAIVYFFIFRRWFLTQKKRRTM